MTRALATAALLFLACARSHAGVKEASVEDVAAWMQAGTATVYDANNESFRKQNGTVPGAVLLDNYREYDLKVLGDDKSRQLVFYCSNKL